MLSDEWLPRYELLKNLHISIALCDANEDGWLNAKSLYQFSDISSDLILDMNCTFILKALLYYGIENQL